MNSTGEGTAPTSPRSKSKPRDTAFMATIIWAPMCGAHGQVDGQRAGQHGGIGSTRQGLVGKEEYKDGQVGMESDRQVNPGLADTLIHESGMYVR